MKEYWEENLHALEREDLTKKLSRISEVFNTLPLPEKYDEDQLYAIVELDYQAVTLGLSKKPLDRLVSLQGERPKPLTLLYYYDPMEEQRKFEQSLPDIRVQNEYKTPEDALGDQIRWLSRHMAKGFKGEWAYPTDSALRIFIKKGLIYLQELMTSLGLDYRKA